MNSPELQDSMIRLRFTPKGILCMKAKEYGLSDDQAYDIWNTLVKFCDDETKDFQTPGVKSVPAICFIGGGVTLRLIPNEPQEVIPDASKLH